MMIIAITGRWEKDVTKNYQCLVRLHFIPEQDAKTGEQYDAAGVVVAMFIQEKQPAHMEFECLKCGDRTPTFECMVEHLCMMHELVDAPRVSDIR